MKFYEMQQSELSVKVVLKQGFVAILDVSLLQS